MRYLLVLSGYWFTSAQFGLTINLLAIQIAGTDPAVSWIYAVNAAIVVGLGYVLPRWLERWLSPLGLLMWGLLVIAGGMLLIGFAASTPVLLIAAAVYSFGAVLARPGQETVTANLASPSARGAYFGVASLSLAFGGGLGNYLGGVFFDIGQHDNLSLLPWMVFARLALLSAAGLFLDREMFGRVGSADETLAAVEGRSPSLMVKVEKVEPVRERIWMQLEIANSLN